MKRSSKRRRMPGKLTTGELLAAGHTDLADHLSAHANRAPGYGWTRRIEVARRYQMPPQNHAPATP